MFPSCQVKKEQFRKQTNWMFLASRQRIVQETHQQEPKDTLQGCFRQVNNDSSEDTTSLQKTVQETGDTSVFDKSTKTLQETGNTSVSDKSTKTLQETSNASVFDKSTKTLQEYAIQVFLTSQQRHFRKDTSGGRRYKCFWQVNNDTSENKTLQEVGHTSVFDKSTKTLQEVGDTSVFDKSTTTLQKKDTSGGRPHKRFWKVNKDTSGGRRYKCFWQVNNDSHQKCFRQVDNR